MFELGILYIIFHIATLNINQMSKQDKNNKRKPVVATALKKHTFSVVLEKLTLCILSVGNITKIS